VVCLQELKAEDAAFPASALERAGYGAAWIGQRTWNGVAILAKGATPIVTRRKLPGDASDDQSRYLEAAINGILVASLYAPNGNPQPGPKFDYKLAWLDRLNRHARSLLKEDVPAILAGDYNVVPTPRDIYPTHSWDKDALLQPESRARYATLLGQGWTDALRAQHPDERSLFTFWHYMRNRWARDAGLRLDHILISPNLRGRLKAAGVAREVRGSKNASDHAPVWIEISTKPVRRSRSHRR
jgi:exodeoxyribonuclease-3